EVLAGPVDRLGGGGVEPVQWAIRGAVFVVVAFDDRDVHGPDHIQAFLWVRIIADDISQAGDMGAFLLFDVLQHDLERLEIGVNIGYDGVLHDARLRFQTRGTHSLPHPTANLPSG